jgi:hypothetical protein
MEGCSARVELRLIDSHGIDGLSVHDVEAAASVHQYFGEPCVANDGVDNKRVLTRLWDVNRVIITVKGDGSP